VCVQVSVGCVVMLCVQVSVDCVVMLCVQVSVDCVVMLCVQVSVDCVVMLCVQVSVGCVVMLCVQVSVGCVVMLHVQVSVDCVVMLCVQVSVGCVVMLCVQVSVDCVVMLCALCSSAASDKAAGWNVACDFQTATSSCPADGATVIHQVKCSEYGSWNAHPAYHHISASHSINIVCRLCSQCADNSDWCHSDTRHRCSAASHVHKDVVVDNHDDDHSHQYVMRFTHC